MPSTTVSLSDMPAFARSIAQEFLSPKNSDSTGISTKKNSSPHWIAGFQGDLGAGKTTFIRSLLSASGFEPSSITSPTYAYMHVYEGPFLVYHFDCYRIPNQEAFAELGLMDYIEQNAVCLIEWPGRIRSLLPDSLTLFQLEIVDDTTRKITWLS